MAGDKNGELDMEIQNACFDIEDDEFELETAFPEESPQIDANVNGENGFKANHSLPRKHPQDCPESEEPREAPTSRTDDDFNNSLQMDDGFDDLLSQIDEHELGKTISRKEQVLKPNNNSQIPPSPFKVPFDSPKNSPLKKAIDDEASAFFSTQTNSNAHPPLKRRFPGPAGLLPHLQREELKLVNKKSEPLFQKVSHILSGKSETSSSIYSKISKRAELPPDTSKACGNSVLPSKAPWESLVKNLNVNPKNENDLLNIMNIKWVQTKAKRFPEEMKIPFLAVVVQGELEVTSSKNFRYKNPSVKLMDKSGSIVAAFNPNFLEAYGDKIVPGTALALRNCGVLRLKKHIIVTVAKKNLLCLTTMKEVDEDENSNGSTDVTPKLKWKVDKNKVSLIQTGPFQPDKILEEFKNITSQLNARTAPTENRVEFPTSSNSVNQLRGPSLFSEVSTSLGTKPYTRPFIPPFSVPPPARSHAIVNPSVQAPQNPVPEANLSADSSFGFDDDDDEELLQALQSVDFVIDEDSL